MRERAQYLAAAAKVSEREHKPDTVPTKCAQETLDLGYYQTERRYICIIRMYKNLLDIRSVTIIGS